MKMNLRNNFIISFFRGVRIEIGKVAWPSRAQTTKMTLLVILSMVIAGTIIGAIDFGFSKAIQIFIAR